MSNEEMAIGFCVANIIADKKYIRNFNMDTYTKWISKRDRLYYTFKEELLKYLEEKKNSGNGLNSIVKMGFSGEVSLEFIILLNDMLRNYIYEELNKTDDFLWIDLRTRLIKYSPFIYRLWNINQEIKEKLKEISHSS